MSEENKEEGVMSATKKAIIGAITTAVTAGGAWFATHLGGGEEPKAETPAAVTAPAPVINITNSNENAQKQQAAGGTNTVIIKEKSAPASAPAESKPKQEKPEDEGPW
jgi:hypothetical protein